MIPEGKQKRFDLGQYNQVSVNRTMCAAASAGLDLGHPHITKTQGRLVSWGCCLSPTPPPPSRHSPPGGAGPMCVQWRKDPHVLGMTPIADLFQRWCRALCESDSCLAHLPINQLLFQSEPSNLTSSDSSMSRQDCQNEGLQEHRSCHVQI